MTPVAAHKLGGLGLDPISAPWLPAPPVVDEDDLNHPAATVTGPAAPDVAAHGPELTFWTLGAWRVRGRSGPGSL